MKCLVIAPPPVYHSTEPIDHFKKHIQIFANRYDIVPRLSLYTLAKFYESATIIDQLLDLDISKIPSIVSGSFTLDQQTSQKIIEVLDTATVTSFIELEHPGQIFYLDHAKDSEIYGIFKTPKNFFARMLLRHEMIYSHFTGSYEKAFANVELGK